MVVQREVLEKTRREFLKRRRLIWLISLGVVSLLIIFLVILQFTDVIFGISENAQSAPQSGEWAMFRRDLSHTGNADANGTLPGDTLQWTFHTGNLVTSSPAIAGTEIYVGGQDGHLYAIDRMTGEKLWDIAAGDKITSSPAVAGGMIYIGSEDGKLYAFK